MVKYQQEKYEWEFIFIGANIDAYAEVQWFESRKDRTVNDVRDEVGTVYVYKWVAKEVCSVMMVESCESADKCLAESSWADEIEREYRKRG